MKICPKCGCDRFLVTYHVAQSVMVDSNEDFICTVNECDEITHQADDSDIWTCEKCGYDAAGSEFNVPDNTKLPEKQPITVPYELNENTRKQGLHVNGIVYSLHIIDDHVIITDNNDYSKIHAVTDMNFYKKYCAE